MAARLVRWFFVNVIFGLMPLCASLFVLYVTEKLPSDLWRASPELLFFSLILSITALANLGGLRKVIDGGILFGLAEGVLLVGAAWSAIMYGMFIYGSSIGVPDTGFKRSMLYMSAGVAISSLIVSTITEAFVSAIVTSSEAND